MLYKIFKYARNLELIKVNYLILQLNNSNHLKR